MFRRCGVNRHCHPEGVRRICSPTRTPPESVAPSKGRLPGRGLGSPQGRKRSQWLRSGNTISQPHVPHGKSGTNSQACALGSASALPLATRDRDRQCLAVRAAMGCGHSHHVDKTHRLRRASMNASLRLFYPFASACASPARLSHPERL
jgi:hypothetical protein